MNPAFRLDDAGRHQLAEAVEASMGVMSRSQFFVWTQSSVQGLVPHQILICGARDWGAKSLALHHFSTSRYFRDTEFDVIADPAEGLVSRLTAVAEHTGQAVVICDARTGQPAEDALFDLITQHEMQNVAARLVTGANGGLEGLYAFARVPCSFDSRLRHAVELLIPHLHHTFVRVLLNEREVVAQSAAVRAERVVTRRQEEILRLIKDGKTNAEIATVLDCSQWTIKNHIQNILRRLETTSRAHAISRAMSLGILRPD
jgi:transcriptional regulator EpsA